MTIPTQTAVNLADLKSAATNSISIVYDRSLWNWTLGNYTGQADGIDVVKADSAALTVGAWVRQMADSLIYTPSFANGQRRTSVSKLEDQLSAFDFMTEAQIVSIRARDLVEDVTIPIQNAMNRAALLGAILYLPSGAYKITDTITPPGGSATLYFSRGIRGESANSTRLYFFNTIPLKNLFFIGPEVNYFEASDMELLDYTARTSRCFGFVDNNTDAAPSWKHLLRNIRITQFAEGARFDGGATIGEDTHESEVMFLHAKFRNNAKGLIYNNIQAVNHQLVGTDFENDAAGDATQQWPHIVFERGSYVNHLGGSVIGNGPYLSFKYAIPGGFQNTGQFASKGVRVEKRGSLTTPIIDHDPASTITLSNSFRVVIADMGVLGQTSQVFARVGGRVFLSLTNVHASAQMTVDAYITANLGANAEYGAIAMNYCKALNYNRVWDQAAYGSAGVVASNRRAIPAEITSQSEGTLGATVGGYYQLNTDRHTVYAGGWQNVQIKTLAYAPADSSGIGSGTNPATVQVQLPLYARPCRFRLLRDDINATSPFVMDLYFVVGGVDVLVATITPSSGDGGHSEISIRHPTALANWIVDGVAWDGKMKVVKSGTTNGYVGMVMIDYM